MQIFQEVIKANTENNLANVCKHPTLSKKGKTVNEIHVENPFRFDFKDAENKEYRKHQEAVG